jgi:hypothetical protein
MMAPGTGTGRSPGQEGTAPARAGAYTAQSIPQTRRGGNPEAGWLMKVKAAAEAKPPLR